MMMNSVKYIILTRIVTEVALYTLRHAYHAHVGIFDHRGKEHEEKNYERKKKWYGL